VSRDASFAALLSLSEKLFNRHCAFFRLHGIPIVAASPSAGVSAGGAGGAAAAAALLAAEPWRNTLAVGDSVDYYVERAEGTVTTAGPLVEFSIDEKPLTIAMREINEGLVELGNSN
jgi:hypothetical protein